GPARVAAVDAVAWLAGRLGIGGDGRELPILTAGGGGRVSEPLFAVVASALSLAAATGGAFDPTVEPLTLAWDLRGKGRVPGGPELEAARGRVGDARAMLHPGRPGGTRGGGALDPGGVVTVLAARR